MKPFILLFMIINLVLGTTSQAQNVKRGAISAFPKFKAHNVATLKNGYQIKIADVNKDGQPDIIALSTSPSTLEWYENPGWQKHVISSKTDNNISLALGDIDQDGWIDIALASDFELNESGRQGKISWLQNPGNNGSKWEKHDIGAIPHSHRLFWADFAGDGSQYLVDAPIVGQGAKSPNYDIPARLTAFKISGNPASNHWKSALIDHSLTVIHGFRIIDWNNDEYDDVITASFQGITLFQTQKESNKLSWKKFHLVSGNQKTSPSRGSSEIGVGQIDGERFMATIEPWHGNQVVVYVKKNGQWKRNVLYNKFVSGHGLTIEDLDGDGSDEIIAGYRGKGTSLYAWHCMNNDPDHWERIDIDVGDMATSCVRTADINQDGKTDIVSIGSSTNNIKWYENLSPSKD